MSSLQIGRLLTGPALVWQEAVGQPVTNLGGAPVPQVRTALRHQVSVATFEPDGSDDTLAQRLTNRRQLRSMLNNAVLKNQGGFYVIYSDDPEQNGWYMPDMGQLADIDGSSGLSTGVWKIENIAWLLVGHQRVNREARNVRMKDLRTGLYERDTLKQVLSTDFSALPAFNLTVLPPGTSGPLLTVSRRAPQLITLPTGADGGACFLVTDVTPDLSTVSFERPEASMGPGDVVCYDRRGQITAPGGTQADTSWEEVYGPDYPWNWTEGGIADVPVLANGLVRVRWNSSNTPGFSIDIWTGSAYVEQGKVLISRSGDTTGLDDTWVAAGLYSYSYERATVSVVLRMASDYASSEQVYVTVERGVPGAIFEVYPSVHADGVTISDAAVVWNSALTVGAADVNESAFVSTSQTIPPPGGSGSIAATAGTGTNQFGALSTIGSTNLATSENYCSILQCPTAYNVVGPYQVTLVAVQGGGARAQCAGSQAQAYGVNENATSIRAINGQGYVSAKLYFSGTQADQVMEAEAMTLAAGTASAADGAASGGNTTTSTRTSDAIHVSRAAWPNGYFGKYRVFARVKTTSGLEIYAKTGAITGGAATTSSATYVWIALSDIVADGTALEIHAWATSPGTVYVDRVEAFLVEDRSNASPHYICAGSRDRGQAALYDSRQTGSVVAR